MTTQLKLTLGLLHSPQELTKAVANATEVPDTIKALDYATGVMNEGQENQCSWANLIAVDPVLFAQFESIGQEQHCPTFKVKLKGYKGQDLASLIGKEITFQEYEVAFVFDKFKQPIGLSLVLDLSGISAF
ncbi:hypothetical protein [Streptococcus ruminantium]|uniref:hypothetical protein n=1 Tax=Streptococcus ruminantium TaxID=1917441 RepID=UPI001F26BD5B|nr:hypothetical protein [Streptococcus ruminantium]BDD41361.1 hypothetical protein GUT184_16250 [Streptococcus ruminantium]